jgi:hypothetical protein
VSRSGEKCRCGASGEAASDDADVESLHVPPPLRYPLVVVGVAIGRLLVVAALALGCGASGQKAASGEQSADGEEPSRPDDPVVTLEGPGDEPRSPLRYAYVAGGRSKMFMDMAIIAAIGIGNGPKQTASTPPLRMGFSLEVVDVSSLGTARVLGTLDRVEVLARPEDPKELVETLRRDTGSLVGLKTEASVTNRGFTRDAKTSIPEGVSPKLRSTIESAHSMSEQAAAAFPREPVGIGAHWRVQSKLENAMMRFEQTTLVTLLERKNDRVVLSYTVHQSAPKQPLNVPDVPPGTQTTLERFQGKGNGRSDAPLDGTTPFSEMSVRASLSTLVAVDGQHATVTNDIQTIVRFSPTEPR